MRKSSIIRGSEIVLYCSLGPLRNEEPLCDYHQLLVKSLSPSKQEESSSNCVFVRYLDSSISQNNDGTATVRISHYSQCIAA